MSLSVRRAVAALAALALVASSFGLALTAWAPQAQAATLAEQILCFVDQQLGPDIPFDPDIDYCGSGTPDPEEPLPQCFDGIDNDGDGLVDLNDPGCSGPVDDNETNSPPAAQCADGTDNDGDGLIDLADPGCTGASDTSESPNPNGTGPQCADGIDNDNDGLIDLNDSGCSSASDNDEVNQPAATSTATVTIHKYVGSSPATAGNTATSSFDFAASWSQGAATSTGTFSLAAGNGFQAVTSPLNVGSNYHFNEVTTNQASSSQVLPAGAACQAGMWRLAGYRTGTTVAGAEAAALSTGSPMLNNLSQNQHVIVVNELCPATTTDAALHVDSIDAQKTTAIANDTYADGWRYLFHITTPNSEENLSMRFSDWVGLNASNTIPVANNMRISSSQASSTGPITITAANVYSTPALIMDTDLNPSMPGRQVEVLVEVKIPVGTQNDTYTTTYGVQTLP